MSKVRFTFEDRPDSLVMIYDDDFGFDAAFKVTGDWLKPDKLRYAQAVCRALNAADIPRGPAEIQGYAWYYRDILRRIADGWGTPATLASMALSHVIHESGCVVNREDYSECDCGVISPFEAETEGEPK